MRYPKAHVCWDENHHTCIFVEEDEGQVSYIPLVSAGFEVQTTGSKDFEQTYQPIPDYPVAKAAALYAGYAAETGGSQEAMQILASLTPLTKEQINMATKKASAVAAKAVKEPKVAKPKAVKTEKAPKVKAEKPAKEPKAAKDKKPSAAARIRELIMEGLSDAKIFAKMVKEFEYDDSKKGYPASYRKQMANAGLNPPESA